MAKKKPRDEEPSGYASGGIVFYFDHNVGGTPRQRKQAQELERFRQARANRKAAVRAARRHVDGWQGGQKATGLGLGRP